MSIGVWPSFFIVGAAKCGTTSLYAYLASHPEVFMCRMKEPHYFSQVRPSHKERHLVSYVSTESDYLKLFLGADKYKAVGEASPSYLWDRATPDRIYAKVPEAKIVILLRDPIERAYSHYLMDVRSGTQRFSFYEALREDMAQTTRGWGVSHLYVELGMYAQQVQRYLEVFGPEQVLVCLFDDFRSDPKRVLRDVATFIGINPDLTDMINTEQAHNPYGVPANGFAQFIFTNRYIREIARLLVPKGLGQAVRDRVLLKRSPKPSVDNESRELLKNIYNNEINALEKLLNRSLPELRKGW